MRPGKTMVKDSLERWLKDYAWPNLASRTAEGYDHIIRRHLIPNLGSMSLTKLKPEHLQRCYAEKLSGDRLDAKRGLSPKSVRHHHVTLHDVLQSAVKWGLLARGIQQTPLTLPDSNVDLVLGQLSVVLSLHHLRNGETVFRAPKTVKGKRMIALSPVTWSEGSP